VAFNPDGKTLASGSDDKTIKLWETTTGRELRTLLSDAAFSVAFSPDGQTLASAGSVTADLWDVRTGMKRATMENADLGVIEQIAFSSDGTTVYAAGTVDSNGIVRFWDTATAKRRRTVPHVHVPYVYAAALSPDGKKLAFGGSGNRLFLWDMKRQREIWRHDLPTPTGGVRSCVFSPDGWLLAAARDDGTVRLWNLEERFNFEPKTIQLGPASQSTPIRQVTFTPDGRHLITANGNGTVYVLRLKEWLAK